MNSNNIRFDLSPFLIHFFRKVDLEKGELITPEDWGPGEIVEDTTLSPIFLLRNALRIQRLWATWSERTNRRTCESERTVYGPYPAVCFTDMPIAAFLEAGEARAKKKQAMSPIGLVLPRAAMLKAGARPAIYGLSTSPKVPKAEEGEPRLIPSTAMPLKEQYRYVTLRSDGRVDWMHEREWRWPYKNAPMELEEGLRPNNGKDIPGLDLGFDGMGVIVRTEKQVKRILHDVLVLADQKRPGRYDFILVRDKISSLKKLRSPAAVQEALSAASIDLEPYLKMAKSERKALSEAFNKCVHDVPRDKMPSGGKEDGGCWLWLTDVTHQMTRALKLEGRVTINCQGNYLVDVGAFSPNLSLAKREELTRRLSKLLLSRHGVASTYYSVLGKFDPDELPFYSAPPFESRFIFNYGDNEEDY